MDDPPKHADSSGADPSVVWDGAFNFASSRSVIIAAPWLLLVVLDTRSMAASRIWSSAIPSRWNPE
ncbi:MAG TPA: hypothetical protein VFZ63_09910 [Jiangellaceae bacterium]